MSVRLRSIENIIKARYSLHDCGGRRGPQLIPQHTLSCNAFKLATAGLSRVATRFVSKAAVNCQTIWRTGFVSPQRQRWEQFQHKQIKVMVRRRKRKDTSPDAAAEDKDKKAQKTSSDTSSEEEAGPSPDQADKGLRVNPKRYRELKGGEIKKGPVIYWWVKAFIFCTDMISVYQGMCTLCHCKKCLCRMSRDQRIKDNWALLYACEVAQRSDSNVVLVFNLVCFVPSCTVVSMQNILLWQTNEMRSPCYLKDAA